MTERRSKANRSPAGLSRVGLSRLGLGGLLALTVVAAAAGCGAPVARFRGNVVYREAVAKGEDRVPEHERDVADVLTALFGTPDHPQVPAVEGMDVAQVLDLDKLKTAAGPVGSDVDGRARGLYREHCVHCHGISGDGAGPTAAFLNPYPRDYRRGTFKFKSTLRDEPPTHEDLKLILVNGIPGTAMPSFKLLDEDELEALIHYVRYLAVRGEVERLLLLETVTELGVEDRLVNADAGDGEFGEQTGFINSLISDTITKWQGAEEAVLDIPPPPKDWDTPASIARGKKHFFSKTANCYSCHGDLALGRGTVDAYDEWTLDWYDPKTMDNAKKRYFTKTLMALEPRHALPRNLRQGIYRGGRRPIDMYRRIKEGVPGSPMPKAAKEVTSDQIWDLVAYIRTLPYESISDPRKHVPEFQRDRS